MKTGYEIKHMEGKIILSKDFLMKAGCLDTKEFQEMRKLREQLPGYEMEEYKIAQNPNKQTYGRLTYDTMKSLILGKEPEETVDATLEEFEKVKKYAKAHKAAYVYVKKWFLDRYSEDFKTKKQKKEEAEKLLLTTGKIVDFNSRKNFSKARA